MHEQMDSLFYFILFYFISILSSIIIIIYLSIVSRGTHSNYPHPTFCVPPFPNVLGPYNKISKTMIIIILIINKFNVNKCIHLFYSFIIFCADFNTLYIMLMSQLLRNIKRHLYQTLNNTTTCGIWTHDRQVCSLMLYPLSYRNTCKY